jgi:sugar lactone lactonase YvrE
VYGSPLPQVRIATLVRGGFSGELEGLVWVASQKGGYVTNSAFGGDNRTTLYITTSQAIYQIALNVPGFPN